MTLGIRQCQQVGDGCQLDMLHIPIRNLTFRQMATPCANVIGRPFSLMDSFNLRLANPLLPVGCLTLAKKAVGLATIAKELNHLELEGII